MGRRIHRPVRSEERGGEDRPRQKEGEHLFAGGGGAVPGPVVGVAHVLLVHLENLARAVLDALEQGKHPAEIGVPPDRRGQGLIDDTGERRFEPAEVIPDHRGFFPFSGKRDRIQLDLEGRPERGRVRGDQGLALLRLSEQNEEEPAIHALERLFHLLAGDDAPIILPQDDVDGRAQARKIPDALDADNDEDGQHPAETQEHLLSESEHVHLLRSEEMHEACQIGRRLCYCDQ